MSEVVKTKKFKLILGLGNQDLNTIERIITVYNQAGIDVVDIAPCEDVFNLTKKILSGDTKICVSVPVGEDKHSLKAKFSKEKCNLCGKCLEICQEKAFYFESGTVFYDRKKCVGCQKCGCEAIEFEHEQADMGKVIELNPDEIEIHISTKHKNEIIEKFEYLVQNFDGGISVCLSRENFSDSGYLGMVDDLLKISDRKISIQVDGKAISGGEDSYHSTLQAIASADLLRDYDVNIILSGGTNSKTAKLANLCSVKYDMVAIGSYARKLVINSKSTEEAIEKAKALVESVKNSD